MKIDQFNTKPFSNQLHRQINQASVLHLSNLLVLIASCRSFAKTLDKATLSFAWLNSEWTIWFRLKGQLQIIASGLLANRTVIFHSTRWSRCHNKLVIEISKWSHFLSPEQTATSAQKGKLTALHTYWTCSSEKLGQNIASEHFLWFFICCSQIKMRIS